MALLYADVQAYCRGHVLLSPLIQNITLHIKIQAPSCYWYLDLALEHCFIT